MDDKEKLIELLYQGRNMCQQKFCYWCIYEDQYRCSQQLTADHLIENNVVIQKHGRWIFDECDGEDFFGNPTKVLLYCQCSICKRGVRQRNLSFCPYCGAKMDWEE